MFFKIRVLRNFSMFTGKHLCWSLFKIKLQALQHATLFKRDFNADVSLLYCKIFTISFFTEHLPYLLLSLDILGDKQYIWWFLQKMFISSWKFLKDLESFDRFWFIWSWQIILYFLRNPIMNWVTWRMITQLTFTCSMSTIETVEKGTNHVQS